MTSRSLVQDLLYSVPYYEDMPRRQFQDFARYRLAIYQALDCTKEEFTQSSLEKLIAKGRSLFVNQEELNLLHRLNNPVLSYGDTETLARMDITSHYICRLMFCLSQEKKESFISYEMAIFKSRIRNSKSPIPEKDLFEALVNQIGGGSAKWGEISEVTPEEFQDKKLQIYASTFGAGAFETFSPKRLYKVPVESCDYLVSRRECFVSRGFAYVDGEMLLKVIPKMYGKYLTMIMNELQNCAGKILADDHDNQFRQFIRNEPSTIFNQVVAAEELKEKLNLKNISVFSKRSFPPCMMQMHDVATTKKHLKHEARLQLTLFLKVAGLSIQDAQTYWKNNYTHGVNESKQKQVQYNVRHTYGQEGKRTDYNSKDCQKIISSKPTAGEYHGCPFKYYGKDELSKFLSSKYPGIDQSAMAEILHKKEENHFQLACRSLFQRIHPQQDQSVNHVKGVGKQPNMYYYQSEKYHQSREK